MFPTFQDELGKIRIQELRDAADHERLTSSASLPGWRWAMGRRLINAGARLIGACADEFWHSVQPARETDAALR